MPPLFKYFLMKRRFRQKGVALILMAVILALAASAYAIRVFDISSINARQDAEASAILANAKSTLIGYTLGRAGVGERPGNMPYPDYFASTESPAPGDYDGTTDGCMDASKPQGLPLTLNGTNMRCLGRLPWQTIGLAVANPSQSDSLGTMPWYAVSANLVDTTCLKPLNPSILNMTYASYVCAGATLPHPWLTVRDSRGNIISNRVAVVLILPGPPMGAQTRASTPLGNITNYLDNVVVPAGCLAPCIPGTYSNAGLNNEFIMASNLSGTSTDQNNQNLASSINDKVLFITIDELMSELTKRAAGEARTLLNKYNAKTSYFPFAAPLGATLNNNISGVSTIGSLPIDVTDSCSCASTSSCSCSFSPITNVAFKIVTGTWSTTNHSGACSRTTSKICTCSGAGYCKNSAGTINFTCSSAGVCTNNVTGIYTYTLPTHADVYVSANNCTNAVTSSACTGAGTFDIGLKEPTWFKNNLWQDYFYYHQSSTASLQIGTHTGVSAVLIGAGATIGAQTRPSSIISNYLDSTENTNNDNIYDAIGAARTNTYNDQSFIVAP